MSASDTIIAPVTFAYKAEVILKGHRKASSIILKDTAPASFRRISAPDLKPAVILHDACISPLAYVRGEQTLYGFEGALWAEAPAGPANDGDYLAENTVGADAFLACIAEGAGYGPFGIHNPQPFDVDHIFVEQRGHWINVEQQLRSEPLPNPVPAIDLPRIEDVDIRKIETADRDSRAADMQRIADSIVICGDKILFRRHEPKWLIRQADILLVFGSGTDNPDEGHVFRADREDAAINWLRLRRQIQNETTLKPDITGRIEVLDGSFFSYDDLKSCVPGPTFAVAMKRALHLISGEPAETLVEWAKTRDMARDLESAWSRDLAETLVKRLCELRTTLDNIPKLSRQDHDEFKSVDRSLAFITERAGACHGVDLSDTTAEIEARALKALAG